MRSSVDRVRGAVYPSASPTEVAQCDTPLRTGEEVRIVANHKSAIKRIRQNKVRNLRNRYWRSSLRTAVKKVRVAVTNGDVETAQVQLHSAIRVINRVASKGVIHKNNASRRVSRLTLSVNKLRASADA